MAEDPYILRGENIAARRAGQTPDIVLVPVLSGLLLISAWQEWLPIHLTEAWGFATGAVCVWLVTKENIWN